MFMFVLIHTVRSNTGASMIGKTKHMHSTMHEGSYQYELFMNLRDIAPMGPDLKTTNQNLDEMVDLALELQKETGVKLLWATCNLFAHPVYACGASTNPDASVFAMAGAQVKKGLEIAKRLGAEGFGEIQKYSQNISLCNPVIIPST